MWICNQIFLYAWWMKTFPVSPYKTYWNWRKLGFFYLFWSNFAFWGGFFSLLTTYGACSKLTTSIWSTLVNQMGSSPASRGYLGKHISFVCFQSLCLPPLCRILSRMLKVQLSLVQAIYRPVVCGFIEYLFDQTFTAWLLQTQDREVHCFLHTEIHYHFCLSVTCALRDHSQL